MGASRPICRVTAALVLAVLALAPTAPGQGAGEVEIETIPVAGDVFMLQGAGGNIGVSAGEGGVLLVDSQYGVLTDKIGDAVAALSDEPIRFVLNTHWHRDHTDGNENIARAGALVVAHENVRARMSSEQTLLPFNNTVPPSPPGALPAVTFSDGITFHMNGGAIRALRLEPAHTDGDTVVFFSKANAVHMGDVYFNGMYPFIDVNAGGSIDGMIAAVERVLGLIDAEAKVIPGHGPLSDREGLESYCRMLKGIRDRIAPMVAAGKSLKEVIDAKPTADFDDTWGKGFLDPDRFTGIVYEGMTRR